MAESSLPRALSGKFTGDFAYPTIKDRLPVILTKILDAMYRNRTDIKEKYGPEGAEESKEIIGELSQLRSLMMTNKPIGHIKDGHPDNETWGRFREEDIKRNGEEPHWYATSWLYAECYFYRKIIESFKKRKVLNMMDPFGVQKKTALTESVPAMTAFIHYLRDCLKDIPTDTDSLQPLVSNFLQLSLWSNKCDLSISAGEDNHQTVNPMAQLDDFKSHILVDHSSTFFTILRLAQNKKPHQVQLDIVLDNAGFEFFSDLCLAEFLTSCKLVNRVIFHIKRIPWFVSDVTQEDVDITLSFLKNAQDSDLAKFAQQWEQRFKDNVWKINVEDFWTTPYAFPAMKEVAPELYKSLGQADAVLFKGDLNHRKLLGDLKWEPCETFKNALQGFFPAPVCSLRTLKCDVVVGLKEGVAEQIQEKDENWQLSGSYGVIQMHEDVLDHTPV